LEKRACPRTDLKLLQFLKGFEMGFQRGAILALGLEFRFELLDSP